MNGSGRLLRKSSVDAKVIGLLLAGIWTMPDAVWAAEQPLLRRYEVVGDAIPDSLTGSKGDPTVGRAIVLSRRSTCLLCHSGPFPEERFQGNVGPDLTGLARVGRKASSGSALSMQRG
jgi:L-cysteine S-thiosulfotransferase